jgi:hypothetical protein
MKFHILATSATCLRVFYSLNGVDFKERGVIDQKKLHFVEPVSVEKEVAESLSDFYHIQLDTGEEKVTKTIPLVSEID